MEPLKAPVIGRYYLLALGLIALMVSASWLAEQTILSKSAQSAKQVNVAGRQRMLSQRIALLLNQYYMSDTGQAREAIRLNIYQLSSLFRQSFKGLLKGDEALGLPPEPELGKFYCQYQLDQLMAAHNLALVQILSDIDNADMSQSDKHAALITFSNVTSLELLQVFDQLTKRLEDKSEEEIEGLHHLETSLFIAVLILLVLEALFIFKPLVKSVRSYIATIEQHNAELEELDTVRSQFLMNISHLLRTPLNHVLGFSRRLAQNKEGNFSERELQATESIEQGANELKNTVDDIYRIVSVKNLSFNSSVIDGLSLGTLLDRFGAISGKLADDDMRLRVNTKALEWLLDALGQQPDSQTLIEFTYRNANNEVELVISCADGGLDSKAGPEAVNTSQLLAMELIHFFDGHIISSEKPLIISIPLELEGCCE